MAYADFDFYRNEYKGILIKDNGEYAYFGERAGDELASFAKRIPTDETAQTDLKKCACAVADILFGDFKQSKNGIAKINSESVSGYYSVSYSAPDSTGVSRLINATIMKYLGGYIIGKAMVMM